jgi:hypothetical protein
MHILSRSRILTIAGSLLLGTLFFSCSSVPQPSRSTPSGDERDIAIKDPKRLTPPKIPEEDGTAVESVPFVISLPTPPLEEPPVEEPPREGLYIMGNGRVDPADLSVFFLDSNPGADPLFVEELASLYQEESAIEGINHDIAFAQMCLETGFLRFGSLVTPEMNNFCGLGAINIDHPGESFPTPQIGVRAHIQHLKAYASDEGLNQDLVDPRYRWVRYGSAPTVDDLTGTWATDREYGIKIRGILERIYIFTGEE